MATATTTKTPKSLKLACPYCGDEGPAMNLGLNELPKITCSNCDVTFTPREAVEHLAKLAERWEKVAAWIESAGAFLAG